MVANVAAHTHYYLHLFDSHGRGRGNPAPITIDPTDGFILSFYAAPNGPPLERNAVLTGRISGAKARITKVLSTTSCIVEHYGAPAWGVAFSQNGSGVPGLGETIDLDNAQGTGRGYLVNHGGGYAIGTTSIAVDTGVGTALVNDCVKFNGHATVYKLTAALSGGSFSITPALTAAIADNEALTFRGGEVSLLPLGNSQFYPAGNQFLQEHSDSLLLTPVDPGLAEWPFWDRDALICEVLGVIVTSGTFLKGDQIVSSSGGFATVHLTILIGAGVGLAVTRLRGNWNAGDTITNLTRAGVATLAIRNSLGTSTTPGAFVRWSPFPNVGGDPAHSFYYERIPNGCGGLGDAGPGVAATLVPLLYQYHQTFTDPADRNFRFVPFSSLDDEGSTDGLLGGVTIQVVKCTGTFPASGTLVVGQTITSPGGWSAVVHGWNNSLKYLFVRQTNGVTLATSTLTTSGGATVNANGPALGWAKGSSHWNNLVAQITAATTASGATSGTAAKLWESTLLQPWETELAVHSSLNACPFPSTENVQQAWVQWISDLRVLLNNPTATMTVWLHRNESQKGSVEVAPGAPYAYFLNLALETLPQHITKLTLIRSNNLFQMASDAPTLYLRTEDYLDLGREAFRHMLFGQVAIASDTEVPQEVPMGIYLGQSQGTGFIPSLAMMAVDRDPDLWPSAQFGGVQTLDVNVREWNCITQTLDVCDIAVNGNTSWGTNSGTCGPDLVVKQRMKRRFSNDPTASTRFVHFKFTVPGSAVQSVAHDASACWDPNLAGRPTQVSTCTVSIPVGSPVRGRFSGAAGTFDPSVFILNTSLVITGSVAQQGLGGNNSRPFSVQRVAGIAPDGSWIDVYAESAAVPFAAETSRPFTFQIGPPPIWPELRKQWIACLKACAVEGIIPRQKYMIFDQAESDLDHVSTYETALRALWSSLLAMMGTRVKGEEPIAKCVVLLHSKTPFSPFDDAPIAQMRDIQTSVAADLGNCVTVDPSGLPLEVNGSNSWPRPVRQYNGVHLTSWGFIQKGFMIDRALGTLSSIPAHPAGEVAVEFGAIDGGTAPASGTERVGTDKVGSQVDKTSNSVDAAAAIADVTSAMSDSPDIASYTTPSGLQVQRRSADELIQLENHLRANDARRRGLRQTMVRFD